MVASAGGKRFDGKKDFMIRLWDLTDGNRLVAKLTGHQHDIHALHVFHDSEPSRSHSPELYLASGSRDGTIILWSLSTHGQLVVLSGHSDAVRSICSFQLKLPPPALSGGGGGGGAGAGRDRVGVGKG